MEYFKCENCGFELTENPDGTYSCAYCKRSYGEDKLKEAYDRVYRGLCDTVHGLLSEELLKQKMQKISNCRQALYKACNGTYIDNKQVKAWAEEILKLSETDAQATFYLLASQGKWEQLNRFMLNFNAREGGYLVESFVDYLTNGRFVEECMLALIDLVERAFDTNSKEYATCHKKIATASENERSGIFNAELPRDVFVAYSSKDKEQAYALVEYLEQNGFTCFIAMRNLAKGVDAELYYNERLKKAMDNCKVFALVSSKNSRSRTCDAYKVEMKYVKEQDVRKAENPDYANAHYELYLEKNRKKCKPRVEYVIEEYGSSIYEQEVKKFFGGLTWCLDMDGVVSAVFDYVENFEKVEEQGEEAELMQKLMSEIQARHAKIQEIKDAEFSIQDGELKAYKRDEKEVIIPEGVTSIGNTAFSSKENLRKIVIPEGVTKIGERAFYECKKLVEVVLPSTLKQIGAEAFYNCWNLKTIELPSSLTEIGNEAFGSCNSISEISLPKSLKKVGNGAFQGCKGIKEFVIPEDWTEIPKGIFHSCISLQRVEIPQSVTKINSHAFCGCSALTEIKIPESVIEIGQSAFSSCENLIEIELPKGLQALDGFVFSGCKKLKSVRVPEGITKIEDFTFYDCTELEKVELSKNLLSIESVAFSGCRNLKEISLPDTVTRISESAFDSCSKLIGNYYGGGYYLGNENNKHVALFCIRFDEEGNQVKRLIIHEDVKVIEEGISFPSSLEEISVEGNKSPYKDIDGNLYTRDGTKLIHYIVEKKDVAFKIPDGVTEIAGKAFSCAENLENVEFPYGLKKIGKEAFKYCGNLKEIHLPDTLVSIENNAFENCSNLKIAYVPRTIENFGCQVFRSCDKLEEFELPSSVEILTNDDFSCCFGLKKLIIPKGLKRISDDYRSLRDTTIYARAERKPTDWLGDPELTIVWGYKDE